MSTGNWLEVFLKRLPPGGPISDKALLNKAFVMVNMNGVPFSGTLTFSDGRPLLARGDSTTAYLTMTRIVGTRKHQIVHLVERGSVYAFGVIQQIGHKEEDGFVVKKRKNCNLHPVCYRI